LDNYAEEIDAAPPAVLRPLLEPDSEDFYCPISMAIMRDPVRCRNGHHFEGESMSKMHLALQQSWKGELLNRSCNPHATIYLKLRQCVLPKMNEA